MTLITDLPDEDLYPLIFRNLSIDDLFNCRLVSKRFKYFSDHTDGLNKLIIGQPERYNGYDYYWFYDNKLIDDKDIISLKCFRSIKLLSLFNLNKNLKHLKICDIEFKLEELSNLINLESLQFGYNLNKKQQIINLNHLKVLVSSNNNLSFELNTPKLEKIKLYDINKIKLDFNPHSIKHLIIKNYDHKLEIFKNLEIIEFRDNYESMINENLLINFKYLKQLKVFESSYERIENSLIKILNDKIKLRRDIEIYLEGVKIENMNKFNEFKANKSGYWKFILNNYDLLDLNVQYINHLYYDELEECVNNIANDLPFSFFQKFQYIHSVYVFSVNDVNGLKWFFRNLNYLSELVIGPLVSLDEVFYNNLPNTIRYLNIYSFKDINYDFILKLSKLIEFYTITDKDLFDLAFKSFLNLKYLKTFEFYFKRRLIKIEKNGKDFYLNLNEKILDKEILDYYQLIEKCNSIRLK